MTSEQYSYLILRHRKSLGRQPVDVEALLKSAVKAVILGLVVAGLILGVTR